MVTATLPMYQSICYKVSERYLILIYLLIAIGLTPGDSSTVHIYTQTIHRTAQLTTLVGRLSGIRTQSGQTKINKEMRKNYRLMGRVRAVPFYNVPSRCVGLSMAIIMLKARFKVTDDFLRSRDRAAS
jgi:hypothetical protein